MPTVKLGVLACFLLPASLAVAVEWGRGSTYKPRPMVYVEAAGSRRLVIYNGPVSSEEFSSEFLKNDDGVNNEYTITFETRPVIVRLRLTPTQ